MLAVSWLSLNRVSKSTYLIVCNYPFDNCINRCLLWILLACCTVILLYWFTTCTVISLELPSYHFCLNHNPLLVADGHPHIYMLTCQVSSQCRRTIPSSIILDMFPWACRIFMTNAFISHSILCEVMIAYRQRRQIFCSPVSSNLKRGWMSFTSLPCLLPARPIGGNRDLLLWGPARGVLQLWLWWGVTGESGLLAAGVCLEVLDCCVGLDGVKGDQKT